MNFARGNGRPKILCLTSHNLDGRDHGAAIRARNIFGALAQIGDVRIVLAGAFENDVGNRCPSLGGFELADVIPFHPAKKFSLTDTLRYEFDGRFLNTHRLAVSGKDRERMQKLVAEHDLVWIQGLRIANSFGLFRWPHSALDVDDIPSAFSRTNMAQAKSFAEKFRYYRRAARWQRRERKLPERFDALCVCSEPNRRLLGGSNRIFVVPNGFTAPENIPRRNPAAPPRIGFIGNLQYSPNSDGVRWFLESVWPLVLGRIPDARLRLAGGGSEQEIWKPFQNVDCLGWISDVEGEMATWSLAIVPLFVGGGTRIKIAEAFSRKCPVVSTKLGAYGYDVLDGRELSLADASEEFAAKCVRILKNPDEGRFMAENAWQKFLANWTWDSIGGQVAKTVESILRTKDGIGSSPRTA
jgi:glycosyltransferase involved in cell wall biosynthesis